MAKKRRNTKKKHNDSESSNEFLADVPETSSDSWEQGDLTEQGSPVVDPYAEQFEAKAESTDGPQQ